jgi:hypothetical protein
MMFALQGRSCIGVLLLWFGILSCGVSVAAAQDRHQVQILFYDDARVQQSILEAGKSEAGRIFRLAGIRLAWVNCYSRLSDSEREHCRLLPGMSQFVLRVIPKGKASSDLVFGEAFLGESGTGKYADIFFDRIEAAHDKYRTSVPRLLGAVAAHELGHLFLGFQAHSWIGIMTPVWESECLRRMNMGNLLFTPEQAARMQSRLQSDSRKFTALANTDTKL